MPLKLYIQNIKISSLVPYGDLGYSLLTASKAITTGQGGIIVTNKKKLYNKIKLLKTRVFSVGPTEEM